MSLDGNSRISQFRSNSEMVRRSRTGDLASSSDVDQARASLDRLRAGLEANSSEREEGVGYVNGKFSVRHFLDDVGVGRVALGNGGGNADRFMSGELSIERFERMILENEQRMTLENNQRIVTLESRKTAVDAELARVSSPTILRRNGRRTKRNPDYDPHRTNTLRQELTNLNTELSMLKA
jgi:hypothetical protein